MNNSADFVIENGVLKKYSGAGGDVVIPTGVRRIGKESFLYRNFTRLVIPDGVRSVERIAFAMCKIALLTLPDSLQELETCAFQACKIQNICCSQTVLEPFADKLTGYFDASVWKDLLLLDRLPLTEQTKKRLRARIAVHRERVQRIPRWIRKDDDERLSRMLSLWRRPDLDELDGYLKLAEQVQAPKTTALLLAFKRERFSAKRLEKHEQIKEEKIFGLRKWTLADWRKIFTISPLTADTACITAYKASDAEVVIPEKAGRYAITAIGRRVFADNTHITGVTIPEGVETIGEEAFNRCCNLTRVTLPQSLTSIGADAFNSCYNLTDMRVPESVASIGIRAFFGCKRLADAGGFLILQRTVFDYFGPDGDIVIPDGVKRIGDTAFYNKTGLTGITIPEGVESIGLQAFGQCFGLTSVTVPESITSIGESAFRHCKKLADEGGFVIVCGVLFGFFRTPSNYYTKLNIVIPDSVWAIGKEAFWACHSMQSVRIPDGVTSIGTEAFYTCSNLKTLVIPDSVTTIEKQAFEHCARLTSVKLSNRITCIRELTFAYCEKLQDVTIPDGVTEIGDEAFRGCKHLTEITIPDGVTSIGASAFRTCSSLTRVTIPASVTSIGARAFLSCRNLTVYAPKGSAAEAYAKEHGIPLKIQ